MILGTGIYRIYIYIGQNMMYIYSCIGDNSEVYGENNWVVYMALFLFTDCVLRYSIQRRKKSWIICHSYIGQRHEYRALSLLCNVYPTVHIILARSQNLRASHFNTIWESTISTGFHIIFSFFMSWFKPTCGPHCLTEIIENCFEKLRQV